MTVRSPSIAFYQPVYRAGVRAFLDPGFVALDWLHNPTPELRELALHLHIAQTGLFNNHDLTGLLSPKFYSKTGLTSHDVMSWIAANPGYEVYCIAGRPFMPYTGFDNIARSKRMHGPDFDIQLRSVADMLGVAPPATIGRHSNDNLFHCNYWCATPTFWRGWRDDILAPLMAIAGRGDDLAQKLLSPTPYRSPTPVFLIAFIYERLLMNYLTARGVRRLAYPWRKEQILALDYHPLFRTYLEDVLPWAYDCDVRGDWTKQDAARLDRAYEAFRQLADIEGHEVNAFAGHDFDMPRHRPSDGRVRTGKPA